MALTSKILGDRIILESVVETVQSKDTLLILPEEKMAKLVVVAVGTSKDIPEEVKPGCRVWASARSASPITLDGKDYFLIKSADLLAVQTN